MNCKERITGKSFNESLFLNMIYTFFMICYIIIQYVIRRKIEDGLFIILLSLGTYFVNLRQKKLYINIEKNGEYFIKNGYSCFENDINRIFNNKVIDIFACIYGLLFGCIVSFVLTNETNVVLKIMYALFLSIANIPTFLAIYRLISLWSFFVKIVKLIKFDFFNPDDFGEKIVVDLRNFVLFTAVTYTTVCLTSVVFTKINLGIIYCVYTGASIVLILFVLAYSNYYIYKNKNIETENVIKLLNKKINNEIKKACEQEDYYKVDKIEGYIKFKEIITAKILDFDKILVAIKLVVMTLLPIFANWILKFLEK